MFARNGCELEAAADDEVVKFAESLVLVQTLSRAKIWRKTCFQLGRWLTQQKETTILRGTRNDQSGCRQDYAPGRRGFATSCPGMQQQGNCGKPQHQSTHGQTTLAHIVLARRTHRG